MKRSIRSTYLLLCLCLCLFSIFGHIFEMCTFLFLAQNSPFWCLVAYSYSYLIFVIINIHFCSTLLLPNANYQQTFGGLRAKNTNTFFFYFLFASTLDIIGTAGGCCSSNKMFARNTNYGEKVLWIRRFVEILVAVWVSSFLPCFVLL